MDGTRRDFLYVASGAMAAVGAAAAAWPFVDQMNPSAAALALSTVEVDLAPVAVGQQIVVKWRGHPLFVRRRTPAEIDAAKKVDVASLPDPLARNEEGKRPADFAREAGHSALAARLARLAAAPRAP